MSWFAFILLLFALSWAGVGLFRWYAIDQGILDNPNERSSHTLPTPRGGGVIFFVGWMILLGMLYYHHIVTREMLLLFSPAIGIGLIGFWDDKKGLSASIRFITQCIAAALSLFLIGEMGYSLIPWLTVPLPVCFLIIALAMVWTVNLFNFMDGSDGLATSQGIFVFAVGGYLLFQYNALEMATLAWGLASLLGGFLIWNWPTAKIFMGDCGSCFLGFMVALYALMSYKQFNMPIEIWIILTGVFWFDATLTLLRRILAGENWRKPHRRHAYQRLIQAGWSHQRVLIASIVTNTVLSILAWLVYRDPRLGPFALGVTMMLLSTLYILIEIARPMYLKFDRVSSNKKDICN